MCKELYLLVHSDNTMIWDGIQLQHGSLDKKAAAAKSTHRSPKKVGRLTVTRSLLASTLHSHSGSSVVVFGSTCMPLASQCRQATTFQQGNMCLQCMYSAGVH